jgi:hypothetical protein
METILEMFCQAPSKLDSDSLFPKSFGAGNGDAAAFFERSLDFELVRRASVQGVKGRGRLDGVDRFTSDVPALE